MKKSQKKDTGRKVKSLWKTSFVHYRSETNYALLLWCIDLKFLRDIRRCVY